MCSSAPKKGVDRSWILPPENSRFVSLQRALNSVVKTKDTSKRPWRTDQCVKLKTRLIFAQYARSAWRSFSGNFQAFDTFQHDIG